MSETVSALQAKNESSVDSIRTETEIDEEELILMKLESFVEKKLSV